MRTLAFRLVIVAAVVAVLAVPAFAGDYTGNVNLLIGQKRLSESDWEPNDTHQALGVQLGFGKVAWPVHVAIDYLRSEDDASLFGFPVDAETTELGIGARRMWNRGSVRPFVGGGLAFATAELDVAGFVFDDDEIGVWLDAGALWRIGSRFNLGFDVRFSDAEVEIASVDVDAGGLTVGVLLGFGW